MRTLGGARGRHGDRRLPLALGRERVRVSSGRRALGGRGPRGGRATGPDDRRHERGRHGDRSRQRARPRVSRRARPRERRVGGGGRRGTPRRGGTDAVAVVTAYETAKRAYDAKTKP